MNTQGDVEDVELHGRHELQRILSEEAVAVKLPLLVVDGVVLFPGDTLPLMIPDGRAAGRGSTQTFHHTHFFHM